MSYPFSEFNKPYCGLSKIDCNNTFQYPKVEIEGVTYNAYKKWLWVNGIDLSDSILEGYLATRSCKSFERNLSFPNTPSVSFGVFNNITLFKCMNGSSSTSSNEEIDGYFRRYEKYLNCDGFNLYYHKPRTDHRNYSIPVDEDDLPANCSIIRLPLKYIPTSVPVSSDLFELLSSNFTLDWEVSKDCSKCFYREGQCQSDSKNNLFCSKAAKKNLGLILGSVLGGLFIIAISIVINIICCCKKSHRSFTNVLPRSTPSEPSTQSYELDSGFFGVPIFSYAELQQATMNFDSSRELGDGGYGTVYYGKLQDGREVAVKRLYDHNARRKEQFVTEIEILTRLRHKNLVTLYGCTSKLSDQLLLVYEYVPNGTIADHLHGHKVKDGSLTWPIRMKIAIEAATALAYLHASDIIHRDVKSNNILLDQNFCVKVGDFGLSRLHPTDISHISTAPQGTPGYVDPKYHECYQLTDKSDVYSFGVVLVELLSSMPAVDFSRRNEEINLSNYAINRILRCAFNELIDPSLGFQSDAEVRRMTTSVAEISFRCLQHDKDMRPTMVEVLETLQEIQHGEFTHDKKIDCDGNTKESVQVPLSPESEVDVLLKKLNKFPTSPISVTQVWISDSSTSNTTQGQNTSYPNCTKEFQCGNLRNLSFPFYKSTELDCGLSKVYCDVSTNPIIELEGVKYQALEKNDVFITLKDSSLGELLKKNSCEIFEKNVSIPISPSITYRFDRLLTLFKCNKSQKSTQEEFFNSSSYQSYNVCDSFILYYNTSVNFYYYPGIPLPSGCSFIQLPVPRSSEAKSNNSGLFHLLTDEVILGWTVSDECNQCYYTGGRCQTDNTTNNFHCSNANTNNGHHKYAKVIVAVSAFIGSVVGLCAIVCVLWFYMRRRNDSSQFISRNTSGISMIHHELEERCEYLGIPVFSYEELEEATNKFSSSRELGDGGYGTVYYGKLKDGKEVAVKRLYENNHRQMEQFINEIEILTRLRHPNLVTLYGCASRRSRELFLVYEYIPNGTIADHLNGHRAKDKLLTWSIRLKIAIETASALAYLHASDIIHRDVKTNNILLDNKFCVKVADFGLSKSFPNDVTHISTAPQGTPGYVDPQYHECYHLTDKSDVYSFGVVLVELISSKQAVDMNRHMHEINLANYAMNRILKSAFDEVIDPSLGFETDAEVRRMTTSVAELAFQCLQVVKDMRPTMEEVHEALKLIKYSEWKNYQKKDINSCNTKTRTVKVHRHPSETDDAVLLKKNIPASPDTVIDTWASSSTTTSTGG
ncbi:hypothetical protein KY285_025317 [Solanum tuberosum]|nr:hypothetical protein KY285_025317 [Solanum tuberosum]